MLDREGDGFGATLDPEFAQDAADVELYRRAANDQPLRNLRVVQTLDHKPQDFTLAGTQVLSGRLRPRYPRDQRLRGLRRKGRLTTMGCANGSGELIGADVLQQITERSGLQH